MKNYLISLIIIIVPYLYLFGEEQQKHHFKINGSINAASGTLSLNFFSDYSLNNIDELKTEVHDNKFALSGYISEPQGVFILFDNRYMSPDFIIDKGEQNISIDIENMQAIPKIDNQIMRNEYTIYSDFFKDAMYKRTLFYRKSDSLEAHYSYAIPLEIKLSLNKEYKALTNESDELLLQFSKINPNSNIVLWKLIRLMGWGYESLYDSIFNVLSSEIKSSYAGKVLSKKLQNGKLLTVGNNFPLMQSINIKEEKFSLDVFSKNEYTLVDFWYSSCGPCRAQFNSLKDLYRQYSTNGFEIIGVSIDKFSDKNKWENTIKENGLSWLQYWDVDGKETHNLSINTFPTNYLVDKTGKIIMKNISMDGLKLFLKNTLITGL